VEEIKPPPGDPEEAFFYKARGEIELLFEGILLDR
jgi:hypothetical protein